MAVSSYKHKHTHKSTCPYTLMTPARLFSLRGKKRRQMCVCRWLSAVSSPWQTCRAGFSLSYLLPAGLTRSSSHLLHIDQVTLRGRGLRLENSEVGAWLSKAKQHHALISIVSLKISLSSNSRSWVGGLVEQSLGKYILAGSTLRSNIVSCNRTEGKQHRTFLSRK